MTLTSISKNLRGQWWNFEDQTYKVSYKYLQSTVSPENDVRKTRLQICLSMTYVQSRSSEICDFNEYTLQCLFHLDNFTQIPICKYLHCSKWVLSGQKHYPGLKRMNYCPEDECIIQKYVFHFPTNVKYHWLRSQQTKVWKMQRALKMLINYCHQYLDHKLQIWAKCCEIFMNFHEI